MVRGGSAQCLEIVAHRRELGHCQRLRRSAVVTIVQPQQVGNLDECEAKTLCRLDACHAGNRRGVVSSTAAELHDARLEQPASLAVPHGFDRDTGDSGERADQHAVAVTFRHGLDSAVGYGLMIVLRTPPFTVSHVNDPDATAIHAHVSALRPRRDADDAGGCVSVLSRVYQLWLAAPAKCRALLRLLFVWLGAMSADAGLYSRDGGWIVLPASDYVVTSARKSWPGRKQGTRVVCSRSGPPAWYPSAMQAGMTPTGTARRRAVAGRSLTSRRGGAAKVKP